MSNIKFAVIGCGRMGVQADHTASRWATAPLWLPLSHVSTLKSFPEVELVAVCDQDGDKAARVAKENDVPLVFADVEQLLERVQPEAVSIATRTAERVGIIEKCIAHGVKGIFCEKPLCFTLEEADSICQMMVDKGIHFVFGTRRRYMPVYEQMKRIFLGGDLGDPRCVVISFGSAPLLWAHPHTFDLASFFADDAPILSIDADFEHAGTEWKDGVLDCDPILQSARVAFSNGITAHIVPAGGLDVELCGTRGKVLICSDGLRQIWRREIATTDKIIDAGMLLDLEVRETMVESSGTYKAFQILIDSLKGRAVSPSPELARRNMEMLIGAAESSLGGGRISWPLIRKDLRVTGRVGDLFP